MGPNEPKIGNFKLEMLEIYSGSYEPTVVGWVMKMERYFWLMNYAADIWVDVINTRITNATQAWLDKELQDVQLGQRNL